MADADNQKYMDIAGEIFRSSIGFAVDLGASLTKVLYIASSNENKQPYEVALKVATFPNNAMEDVVNLIKENCATWKKSGGNLTLHSTGVGLIWHTKLLEQAFCVKVENINEMFAIVKGFQFISRTLPRKSILLPLSQKGFLKAQNLEQDFIKMFSTHMKDYNKEKKSDNQDANAEEQELELLDTNSKLNDILGSNQLDDKTLHEAVPNLYPCIIAHSGSACTYNVVKPDGSMYCLDGNTRTGKYMLGMASLLINVMDYDELMSLAEKGDASKLNIRVKDVTEGEDYISMPDDFMVFNFGKAIGKNIRDFQKEDVARALVVSTCYDLVMSLYYAAVAVGAKHVFFTGNFFNHHIIREEVTFVFHLQKIHQSARPEMADLTPHFIKDGGHIGALGALLENAGWKP